MKENRFLDLISIKLRNQYSRTLGSLNNTIWIVHNSSRTFVAIWFRTIGCRHHLHGGCTMCGYWLSDPITPEQMVTSVKEALDTLDFSPNYLLVETSGSIFDDQEVYPKVRREIFRLLSRFHKTRIIFETRTSFISENKIAECKRALKNNELEIEMGLESADPWILKYCINKALDPLDIVKAISIMTRYGVYSSVNILVGTPFLTPIEMVEDAVYSINWAFDHGVKGCVVFPINIKPGTLVSWLKESGMYNQPPLWALVEVFSRLDPKLLQFTQISWYKTPNPKYNTPNREPGTCPQCYNMVIQLLDEYYLSTNRQEILKQLIDLKCHCKDIWYKELEVQSNIALQKRVQAAYQTIGEQILGQQWWLEHGKTIIESMQNHINNDGKTDL